MKRALSIILIFIALTNIVGFMPLYFSLLQEVKSEASLEIAQNKDLQKLQITEAEYNNPAIFSTTGDHEFMFKGQLYDYKGVKSENGIFTFYALLDGKESGLVDFLSATFEQPDSHNSNNKAPLNNLLKNFSKDFVNSFSDTRMLPPAYNLYCSYPATNAISGGHFRTPLNPPDSGC